MRKKEKNELQIFLFFLLLFLRFQLTVNIGQVQCNPPFFSKFEISVPFENFIFLHLFVALL